MFSKIMMDELWCQKDQLGGGCWQGLPKVSPWYQRVKAPFVGIGGLLEMHIWE